MKESGSKIIEAAQKHGFENFEACLDELNKFTKIFLMLNSYKWLFILILYKLPHDDKLEYFLYFLLEIIKSIVLCCFYKYKKIFGFLTSRVLSDNKTCKNFY